jgi:hypothetical protein
VIQETRTNPFKVFSPEHLDPGDVVDLFVTDSPGVDSIQSDGPAMLVGARGAGKSMLLRYMEPDCQALSEYRELSGPSTKRAMRNLQYYTAYLTIRETDLSLPSLQLLDSTYASIPINECLFVLTISLNIVSRALRNDHFEKNGPTLTREIRELAQQILAGHATSLPNDIGKGEIMTEVDLLEAFRSWLENQYRSCVDYVDSLKPDKSPPPYNQKLFRFSTFFIPFVRLVKKLPSMPESNRFFLAIDDADKLSETQTKILNTWLSRRNTDFSLKVAYEMYGYKTFYTASQTRIEAPHDYQEIRISDVYTSNKKTNFRQRMHQIVSRRLVKANITRGNQVINPDDFFPEDNNQRIKF